MTQQPVVGSMIGRFQVLSELGRGGMAVVYRALQSDLDRVVALKVLPAHLTDDPSYVARFRQEARSAAKLEHPHIMPIYEVGETDGYHYIAMKFIAGRTLKQIVQQEGALDPVRAARYLAQVADALDYAHRRGVIHRDIKPSNVMLTEEDWVFLTDFGLARGTSSGSGATAGLTVAGTVMGTPEYMSPEQAQGLATIGPPTDIYAMGVMLYELLTGSFPFQGDTPLMVMSARLFRPPTPPRNIRPDLPTEVEDVIMRSLARKPEARYQTAGEMIQALRLALHIPEAALRPGVGATRAAGPGAGSAPLGQPASPQRGTPIATPPSPQAGTPIATPHSPQRGTPIATPPSPQYGTPIATPPSPQYGTPIATPPSPQYGTPIATPPSPQRGAPIATPTPQAGPPIATPASPAGGLPAQGQPFDNAATVAFGRGTPPPPVGGAGSPGMAAPTVPFDRQQALPPYQQPYPMNTPPVNLPTASLPPGMAVGTSQAGKRRRFPIVPVVIGVVLLLIVVGGGTLLLNRPPSAAELVSEGTAQFLAGDMTAAEASFNQALETESDNAAARLALAQLATARGNWNQLIAEAETAVGLGDAQQDALAYSYLAIGHLGLDDYSAAEDAIARALDSNRQSALAHAANAALLAERAEFSGDRGLLDQAYTALDEAGQTIGNEAPIDASFAYNLLGSVYARDFSFNKNPDLLESAIQIHEKAIDLTPAMALHHIGLAFVYYDFANDVEAARGEISEALRLEPDSAYTLSGAGWAAQRENDPETARQRFEEALQIDPTHYEARHGLGYITGILGDFETSITLLQGLIDEYPNSLMAYTWLGDAYAGRAWTQTDSNGRIGDFETALKLYLAAIDRGNETTWSWTGLGLVHRLLTLERDDADFTDSNTALEKAIAADGSNAQAMVALCYNMLDSQEYARAEQLARRAVEAAPDMAEAHFARGLTFEYLERYPEALDSYQIAAKLNPDLSGLSDALDRVTSRTTP